MQLLYACMSQSGQEAVGKVLLPVIFLGLGKKKKMNV